MATFTVSNLNDSGAGSLRDAITQANANGGADTITFSVAGTITLASDLPSITGQVSILAASATIGSPPTVGIDCNGNGGLVFAVGSDGSQLSGVAIGNATGNGVTLQAGSITLNNNYIGLALNGTAAANSGDGVFVAASSSNNNIGYNPLATSDVVANVISNNLGNGISFHGSNGNTVVSNRIGTSVDGTTAMGNGGQGIWVTQGSDGNTIGGTAFTDSETGDQNDPTGDKGTQPPVFVTPPLGNLISGNGQSGVRIDTGSENNVLNGNFIGTDVTGNLALGNTGDGVTINSADNNSLIGCTFVENPFVYYNVIGGNGGNGLTVTDSDDVTVHANFIGVGANNAVMVPNGNDGILVDGSSQNTAVGGVIPLGNVIAGNMNNGIEVAGTASGFDTFNTFAGTYAFGGAAPNGNDGILITSTGGNNVVRTNVISGNGNNGLEIGGDASGVTVVPNIIGLNTRGDVGGSFGNFNDGILITGTAHDNVIGGAGAEQLSVIRQNTISNNGHYGIEINGAAYNNVVIDSAIGTDIQELAAFPNGDGGVYLGGTGHGNVIGTPIVGISPLASPSALLNIISGNGGPGVTIASGVTGDAVINNWIGLNIVGQATLPNEGAPILNNGGYNVIYGNASTGALPVQSPTLQLEAMFVGWFGRAAAASEFEAGMQTVLNDILGGSSLSQAILDISESFATSPEEAAYAELASLETPATPTLQQALLADSFIDQTFNNLFGRPADLAEKAFWSDAFFSGEVPFSALVYDIAQTAVDADAIAENSKIDAAAYFTTAIDLAHYASSPSERQAAVSGVVDQTTELESQADTDALVSASHSQVTYDSIFAPGDIITGVRADLYGSVILTGSHVTGSGTSTAAFIYQGPLNNTAAGTMYIFDPVISGETITTATFYGPDTSIFDPSLGLGNIRAVGSYQYAESPDGVINHGMLYQGPPNGSGGTWTQIDVPSDGTDVVGGIVLGSTVEDTILHSTQGDLIVGNYDLDGPGGTLLGANGFIYNIVTEEYTLMQINGSLDNLTSLYGIWQHGIGSTSYTIAGGTRDSHGVNVGFLEDYDSSTGEFSNLTFYSAFDDPGIITHFENITAVPGGYSLIATTDSGPAYAFIPVNPDGTFGSATWVPIDLPASDLLTGNIAYQTTIGGIYNTSGSTTDPSTYLGTVDLSFVTPDGGLVMPLGSTNFVYALSVNASFGDTISGSTSAGNMLGGSIGNDTIFGTHSTSATDTVFTGGGADTITLAADHVTHDRIELYAANGLNQIARLTPGGVAPSVSGSIVDANDVPQLGWWGQATGQFGGPASTVLTNAGHGTGTSQDMTTVVNFEADIIDIALDAFSGLLRNLGDGAAPMLGVAIFSNLVSAGGTVSVADADVLRIDKDGGYANAAAVAADLLANPITFAGTQSGAFNHYIIAYQDQHGDVRVADMDIHAASAFSDTAGGTTLSISDMLVLSGVSLADLAEHNFTFLQGGGADVVSGETLVVSAGQAESGLVVQSGGTLEVSSGGSVTATLVLSGGIVEVDSGATATATVASRGATFQVAYGSAIDTVVYTEEAVVETSGTAIHTTVGAGGILEVFDDGVTSGTIISSGGLELLHGSEIPIPLSSIHAFSYDAVISNGGSQTVALDSLASGAIVSSGGVQLVASGGTASATTVSSGGTLAALEGASISGATFLAGATFEVLSGYVLSDYDVTRARTLKVGAGGRAEGTTVSSGAVEIVSGASGSLVPVALGVAVSTIVLGGGSVTVLSAGVTSGDLLIGSGSTLQASETVSSGGTASAVTLSNTAILTVSSGGSAVVANVGTSASVVVMSGGTASDVTLGSGATATLSGGTAVSAAIRNGAVMTLLTGINSAATISTGGRVMVSGGSDLGIKVLNGGQEILASAGAASGTIVSSGGLQIVSSGAVAIATEVKGGGLITILGGTNNSAAISSGGEVRVSAGADNAAVVFQGGLLTVLSGAHTSGANILAGGLEVVSSGASASAGTVISGGQINVLSGGTASGTTVRFGGREAVFAGGLTQAAQVSIDGLEIVSSGGVAMGTVLSLGGGEIVSSGGLASATIVLSSGGLMVMKGGVASSTTVSNGGNEVVSSGGTDRNATVSSGGEQIVSYGGVASATTVLSGGHETVWSGGVATNAVLSGGIQLISRGGIANGTIVSAGEEDVLGTANATVVGAGGRAVMSSGGQANGLVVSAGGSATVLSGGAVSGVTLSGGVLDVDSGGLVSSSTITFDGGGTLVIDDTKFRGKIAGFDGNDPDFIDLTAISFAGVTLGYTGNSASGTLSVGDGLHTIKLAMIGNYMLTDFQAANDGNGHVLISATDH